MGKYHNNLGSGNQRKSRRHQRQVIRERNYFFIQRNKLPYINLSRHAGGRTYYGMLALQITALQKIFIGCGEIEKKENQLYDTFSYVKKELGKKTPTIPGSSIKGSIYHHLSALLDEESMEFYKAKNQKTRIFFSDFPIITDGKLKEEIIAARFKPQIQGGERKFYKKKDTAHGRLTPGEIKNLKAIENLLLLEKGNSFRGFIHFHRLDEVALALLALSMGILPENRFNFKIGGAKNRGKGLIKLDLLEDDSYYSVKMIHAVKTRAKPYRNLAPVLKSTVAGLKKDNPKIDGILKIIREEYRQ